MVLDCSNDIKEHQVPPHTRYDFKAMRQHSSFDQHILCTNHEVTKVMLVSCFLFSLVQSWTNRYVQLQWRLHVNYDYNTHISHWWNCATATFCGWQWIATWQSSKQMSTARVTPALLGCDFHQGLFKIGINFNRPDLSRAPCTSCSSEVKHISSRI